MMVTILRKIVDGLLGRNRPITEERQSLENDAGKSQNNPVDVQLPLLHNDDATLQRSMMMKTIELNLDDAAQVHAILMTHAEMQDHRTLESMQLIGRLERDEPDDARETINDLKEQVTDFEEDCDNLRRLANLFN